MQLYFSHSYRDVAINSYFIEQFRAINREGTPAASDPLQLYADKKSPIWCVAKLERYLFQLAGFVSVIPRRLGDDGQVAFSEYIAYELTLARRSRAPRLLFVDDKVLRDHRDLFPSDAVPFLHDVPQSDAATHAKAIRRFKRALAGGDARRPREFRSRQAALVVADHDGATKVAAAVRDVLRSEGFAVTVFKNRDLTAPFDNIGLFESVLDSELCVFLLGERLSHVNVVLAMAHAQCVPSIRFKYAAHVKTPGADLSGVIRWRSPDQIVEQFRIQLDGFRRGFVAPLEVAGDSMDAARSTAVSDRTPLPQSAWNPGEPRALVDHIYPGDPFVADRVSAVSREIGGLAGRADRGSSHDVCRRLYAEIARRHFYYELEPVSVPIGEQVIRTPNDIDTSRSGTCLDLACLFASLLEAAHQRPLVAIVGAGRAWHAIAGYVPPQEVWWEEDPQLGDLRASLRRGEAVFFEATGAVESDAPVGGETEDERRGSKMLDFTVAKEAAERMLFRPDLKLIHLIDVQGIRRRA